ncbi:copper amine oxidase N-terminal domain-containing protein [bacterium]|nr:MAG: copper amine oxidase N-terminal domain-containing protein [bacterium]
MPYILNGDMIDIDGEPRLENGTLFVPLRKVASALGANVDFEPTTGTAILYMNDQIATFTNGEKSVNLNGATVLLTGTPFIEGGETWIPVRFFESALGYKLNADPQNGIVDLSI